MPTVAEIAAELGIPAETLAAKADVVNKWNGYFSEAENKSTQGAKALADAQALQQVIDQNIASFGITESTNIQLQAQIEALKAAQKTLADNGVKIDLNLPTAPAAKSADEQFREKVVAGFTQMGQALQVQNRYMSVFGKALPDDPVKLADEAAGNRMSVSDYAERKYGFAAEETRKSTEAQAKREQEIRESAVREYREKNPSVAGHPELNGGLPSNYPAIPAPRDAKDLRTFAALPAREKIADAMNRAMQATKSVA